MQLSDKNNALCVSIGLKTVDDVLAAADSVSSLADIIEIRLDCLHTPAVSPFLSTIPKPLLFTNRPVWEGGFFDGPEKTRIGPLSEAILERASYIDLELNAPVSSLKLVREQCAETATRMILSWHNFVNTPSPDELLATMNTMQDNGADIGKIVTMARDAGDVLRVMSLYENAARQGFPLIAFCMGRPGVISRVASTQLGGYMTYCAVSNQQATAPGQLSVQTLHDIYALMGGDGDV